jgi:hypothetical protein
MLDTILLAATVIALFLIESRLHKIFKLLKEDKNTVTTK